MKAIVVGMSREQFEAAASKLKQQAGLDIAGDAGQISHSGVTVNYAYDGAALKLDVLKKPFFLSEGMIESQINGWFGKTSGSAVSTTAASAVALLLCCCMVLTGCTVKQQADAKVVVAKIVSYEPEVALAVDSLASTVALFEPQDALLITAGEASFDAAFAALKVAADAYVATPNNGALASVRAALENVLAVNADQFLAAAKIHNPVSLAAAKAAIVGVREVLLLMDGALQTTQTTATNVATAQARTLKLKDVAPWVDEAGRDRVEAATGHSYRAVYSYETSLGY